MTDEKLPSWNISSIYPSVLSREFEDDIARIFTLSDTLKKKCRDKDVPLKQLLELRDGLVALSVNVSAYSYVSFSVKTDDPAVAQAVSRADSAVSAAEDADNVFSYYVSERKDEFDDPSLEDYSLFLNETVVRRAHMMSLEEENLASEMLLVSARSWEKLHETVTAGISDGGKTLTQLRGMQSSADRSVRKDAFEREIRILNASEDALAACLNGVKGTVLLLEKRRGWKDPVERSLFRSRMKKETLDALISALEDSRDMFWEYLDTKAKLLGLEKLDWYDITAPVGTTDMSYTWDQAKRIIIESYSSFSPEVGAFMEKAFEENWIDAESHPGKIGGAYDTYFPLKKESRVMMNWDGSYDSVSTIAHELGHAYHDYVVRDYPMSQCSYPETLAETASIFGETTVFQEVLKTLGKDESLGIIEAFVSSSCSVCIDILSRYYFEKSAFESRKNGDCAPAEFCRLMTEAQDRAYGDAVKIKHPYMWAVKGHYYSESFSFYNYPYAFGLLFALGLYSMKDQVPSFPRFYRDVLSMTGRYSAEDVAAAAGCDIGKKEFWMKGISFIAGYAEKLKEWL